MTTYAVDCKSPGEFRLAQMIAHKKGWRWRGGDPTHRMPGRNKRLHLHPQGYMTHGTYQVTYYSFRTRQISLSELNKMEKRS